MHPINPWRGKSILITGVCGTVGRELLRQLLPLEPDRVVGIDNNESALFYLTEEYRDTREVQLKLCDVRDRRHITESMHRIQIVLHAAALKHVPLCERSPNDAIRTNILGTQNIIEGALAAGVERVLLTSTDKAVNPTNVMGTSKLMAERLMTAATENLRSPDSPVFVSTRFGNVLGSNGSVVPLFRRQLAAGGPLTLTDPRMTRFIMSLAEAVRLVLDSVLLGCGGEVFVTKMPSVRIEDVAQVMRDEYCRATGTSPERMPIVVIGSKPGEKLYEELVNEEEVRRTIELQHYFVVRPAFHKFTHEEVSTRYPGAAALSISHAYNSATQPLMSRAELREYLLNIGLLE